MKGIIKKEDGEVIYQSTTIGKIRADYFPTSKRMVVLVNGKAKNYDNVSNEFYRFHNSILKDYARAIN